MTNKAAHFQKMGEDLGWYTQNIEYKYKKIEKVFVFDNSGIPKVLYDFNKNQLIVDGLLLSGLLNAIKSFSTGLFNENNTHFMIDNGTEKITLFKNYAVTIAIISDHSLLHLKDKFLHLLDFFTKKYPFKSPIMYSKEVYKEFHCKLIRTLFPVPIAQDWIPVHQNCSDKWDNLVVQRTFLSRIDEKTEIRHLPGFTEEHKENYYEILNYAFYFGFIGFDNFLEKKDLIIGTEKMTGFLDGKCQDYQAVKDSFRGIEYLDLFKDLKAFQRIFNLQEKYGTEILDTLKVFLKMGFIELLNEELSQTLLLIDVLNDYLRILQDVVKRSIFTTHLKSILDDLDYPDIISRINLDMTPILIDHRDIMDRNACSEETEEFYQKWMDFGEILIKKFYRQYKTILDEKFFIRFVDHYLNFFHTRELDLLTPYITKSEQSSCLDVD